MNKKTTLSNEQNIAADPHKNVWVQANAGTGKTSVLVQRLLRILFRSPHNNSGILCLTYTNAGAGEMRNRILAALQNWASASDDELIDLLDGISINRPANLDDAAHAREIFFHYIDNPDILKIKTIHGFCEEILHRFPTEAGLTPAWTLVSDDAQRILLTDAFNKLINSTDQKTTDAFTHIVGRISEFTMPDLLSRLSEQYKFFFNIENIINYRKYFIETAYNFLNLNTPVETHPTPENLKKILDLAIQDQNSRKKPVAYLTNIINLTKQYIDKTIDFNEYKKAYLTADETPISNVAKIDYLAQEMERVYTVNQYNNNTSIFNDTVAMFDLSSAFADAYKQIKQQRNVLDFEDMILYTRKLFSNPETMGWILSQLDLSLSHILVDEAQDTSPAQWDILRMLSGEFFVDGDTQNTQRSLFVVGDSKQSIYSFQGADPRAFALSHDKISQQIQQNMRKIQDIPLEKSFRSTSTILTAVDNFFDDEFISENTGFKNNKHRCFRVDAPGIFELYKIKSKRTDNTTIDDYIKQIATHIKSLIDSGRFAPKDIMILVQKRNPLAPKLVAQLKRLDIDVAGSDRVILPDFPAIRDLLNLIRFCINTNDDFSLCCVLRSPIYRLNNADILKICQIKNSENLVQKNAAPDYIPITVFEVLQTTHPEIFADLQIILDWSKTMSAYTFFESVLNHNDTRYKMIAALGNQIIDPLEEFLTICLAYERTMPGTLAHFLKYFITGNSQIKRDIGTSNGVRVVTVHGSKGLEAPAVFLIDTTATPDSEKIVPITGPHASEMPTWLWSPRKCNSEHYERASDEYMKTQISEYYRLLYVAMTRARDDLYVYGFTTNSTAPKMSWHTQLWRVFEKHPDIEQSDEKIRITNGK